MLTFPIYFISGFQNGAARLAQPLGSGGAFIVCGGEWGLRINKITFLNRIPVPTRGLV